MAMSASALGVFDSIGKSFPVGNNLNVNGQRIESRINELARFGRDENGHGYRVAYTKGDVEGRAWFMELMKKAGLDVTIDSGGNISGKRKGKSASLKPIAFSEGSSRCDDICIQIRGMTERGTSSPSQ